MKFTDDQILTDLPYIKDDFKSLEMWSFGAYGINCSFETEGNLTYIFSYDICAYIGYYHLLPKLVKCFLSYKTKHGVWAWHKLCKEVYLFKDNKYVRIDYDSKQFIGTIRKIKRGFPVLKGNIFEDGIDACFSSGCCEGDRWWLVLYFFK